MSVRIKMHDYRPNHGYVLQRFRGRLPSGSSAIFEAGLQYDVSAADAEYLLAVRSRPDSDRPMVPLAFGKVGRSAKTATPRVVKAPSKPRKLEPEPEVKNDLSTDDLPVVDVKVIDVEVQSEYPDHFVANMESELAPKPKPTKPKPVKRGRKPRTRPAAK